MKLLHEYLEEPFKFEVQAIDYMMTDETVKLVGVVEDGIKSYKKRNLCVFFAKLKNMAFYVYEKGSCAPWVALYFLKSYIEDGRVEILNNLCEQRIKAVKCNKRDFLLCNYQALPKMTGLEVAKLISTAA